jgi:hypothetical protein
MDLRVSSLLKEGFGAVGARENFLCHHVSEQLYEFLQRGCGDPLLSSDSE